MSLSQFYFHHYAQEVCMAAFHSLHNRDWGWTATMLSCVFLFFFLFSFKLTRRIRRLDLFWGGGGTSPSPPFYMKHWPIMTELCSLLWSPYYFQSNSGMLCVSPTYFCVYSNTLLLFLCTEENRDIMGRCGFFRKCSKKWLFPSMQDAIRHAQYEPILVSSHTLNGVGNHTLNGVVSQSWWVATPSMA